MNSSHCRLIRLSESLFSELFQRGCCRMRADLSCFPRSAPWLNRRAVSITASTKLDERPVPTCVCENQGPQERKASDLGRADFGRCGHFNQFSRANIIHVAVHRYGPRNEGVIADASDIGDHAAGFIREGQPIDKVTRIGSRALADILPALIIDLRSFEAFRSSCIIRRVWASRGL
jgi:hypothetical protein